jgi:hypothetical protein
VLIFIAHHAYVLEDRFSNGLTMTLRERRVLNFLESQEQRDFLIISNKPVHYTARNYGAINFKMANLMKDKLYYLLEKHFLQDIYVVQEMDVETRAPRQETLLDPAFYVQELRNYHYDNQTFIRLSRIVPVDIQKNPNPASGPETENQKPVIKPTLYAI